MKAWIDTECEPCAGFGMVLPKAGALADDCELELCARCHGYGRVPRRMLSSGFYGFVAAMALTEGWAYRTRRAANDYIEAAYG